jgi:hypothetical protein
MRGFQAADGVRWAVEAALPGSSNVMIIFHHPDGRTARKDRYNWYVANIPAARNVTARLDPKEIQAKLTDDELALLFRRSMLISAADSPLATPVTHAGA